MRCAVLSLCVLLVLSQSVQRVFDLNTSMAECTPGESIKLRLDSYSNRLWTLGSTTDAPFELTNGLEGAFILNEGAAVAGHQEFALTCRATAQSHSLYNFFFVRSNLSNTAKEEYLAVILIA